MSKGLNVLEEVEQSANQDNDCALNPSISNTEDSGVGLSHSSVSCQESSLDSNTVVRRNSSANDSVRDSTSTDIRSISTRTESVDLLGEEDPWLPFSTKSHSPIHSCARNSLICGKSNCYLHCCNGATTTVPHSAAGCDLEYLFSERSAADSSALQCRCSEERSKKVHETRAVDDDELVCSDADLQHNLAEIKEGVPVNCFDTEHDQVTGTNHPYSTDCLRHSFRQSNLDHFPSSKAENSSGFSNESRPTRRTSLNGLRKAVRSVLVHTSSLISERPTSPAECDPCHLPFESSASEYFDQSSVLDSTEKSSRSSGWKRLSKIDRRNYFGSGRRSHRSGLAIDTVRQSLTHLLRTADHGSSVVGERIADSCLQRPVSSTLTLAGRRTFRRVLSGDFHDVEASETYRLQPELSQTLSGTDDQPDTASDGVTTTYSSELDTSDSFYESRLFDALEAQGNNDDDDGDGGGGGGFDIDSSDDGTYSADSFSDFAPSDDQPTSLASSDRSASVDGLSAGTVPRQSDPAANNIEQDEHHVPVAVAAVVASNLLHQTGRQRSGSDVNSCRLTGGSRCSWTALQQPSGVNDIIDSASRWKRLSL